MNSANMPPTALTCFKAYDVRGELNINFDARIAYRIGRHAFCANRFNWETRIQFHFENSTDRKN